MNKPFNQKCVVIIAGETSGDVHGVNLVRAMKKRDGSIFFCGIGGEALRNEGVKLLADAAELSVVGITEVFSKIPKVIQGMSSVKSLLRGLRPDLIILIDFPDFNLHVAGFAKKLGIPVLYYISPQVWAWRSGRIRKIKKNVDQMAVILPFEKDYYTAHDIPVTFVGHPLLDDYVSLTENKETGKDRGSPVVGLLPGSRYSEIERNLPVMMAAASVLQARFSNIRFIVSLAPSIDREWMEIFIAPYRTSCRVELMPGGVVGVYEKSLMVVAASGTVTLQTAIYGVPMVIVYRISPVSYLLGRILVRVDHIGLVNLIAGERIVPELIQKDATPARIAQTVAGLINDPEKLKEMKSRLLAVRKKLGDAGAAERTAEIALSMLRQGPAG
jgi:lipid-A-disaccharide synthase